MLHTLKGCLDRRTAPRAGRRLGIHVGGVLEGLAISSALALAAERLYVSRIVDPYVYPTEAAAPRRAPSFGARHTSRSRTGGAAIVIAAKGPIYSAEGGGGTRSRANRAAAPTRARPRPRGARVTARRDGLECCRKPYYLIRFAPMHAPVEHPSPDVSAMSHDQPQRHTRRLDTV